MHLSGELGLVQSRPHAEYAVDTPRALHRWLPGQQYARAVPELPRAQHHEQPQRVRAHAERYPSRVHRKIPGILVSTCNAYDTTASMNLIVMAMIARYTLIIIPPCHGVHICQSSAQVSNVSTK